MKLWISDCETIVVPKKELLILPTKPLTREEETDLIYYGNIEQKRDKQNMRNYIRRNLSASERRRIVEHEVAGVS